MVLKLGTEIPGTSAEGAITTLWVPSITDIKHPTIDELEAGTDISNYVMLGGWSFSPSQDTVSDQRENSVQDFGAPGRKSAGDITIEVIDNTNTEHEDANEAVNLMSEGSEGFIVRRRGMATDAPFTDGQKLTVVAVRCGEKQVVNPDANTMIRSVIPLFAMAPGWESETAILSGDAQPAKPVTGVDLTPESASVEVDASTELTVAFTPSDADDQSYRAVSSDESKATVSTDGLNVTVTGKTATDANKPVTITVTSNDGAHTATAQVTVTPKA